MCYVQLMNAQSDWILVSEFCMQMKDNSGDEKMIAGKTTIGCNCGKLLRDVAAENLQLRDQVQALKQGKKKMKAELNFRDRKELVLIVLLVVCLAVCVRGYV